MSTGARIDWTAIDTVVLDMDGTLLDLRFDNWFWLELIPVRYGAVNGMTPDEAWRAIKPHFVATRGTIQWYCIDHWSQVLKLDIADIKRSTLQHVRYLPGAEHFLGQLALTGKRRILATNAHPTTLALKNEQVGICAHFDACYSSHAFAAPKEDAEFWRRLVEQEPFNPARTLFVDDSLPVLHSARASGLGWLRAVRCPDSGRPPQDTAPYAAVDRVADLLA